MKGVLVGAFAAVRRPGIGRAFATSFLGVLVVTALASVLSVGAVAPLLGEQGREIPKTSEQVAAIERYAGSNSDELLTGDITARGELEARVREAPGVDYALLDARGQPLVATPNLEGSYEVGRLTGLLNNPEVEGDRLEESVALIRGGEVGGYLLVEHPLGNAAIGTPRKLALSALLALMALLPVLILAGATLAFAARMKRRLGGPIGELRDAVEKIRKRDLNFEIRYDEPDELGELCAAFGEMRDELREALEREWRGRQELEDTVAALSHDLRTPATVIRGHVEALARAKEEKRSERLERYLPVLEASSQRMTGLLDSILLAASHEHTGAPERLVRLARELARKAQTYEMLAGERGISFSLETPGRSMGEEEPVGLDLDAFERVLDNLFDNALRFTPKGGNIAVEAVWDEREIEVAVRDSGPGLEPGDQPHVFEKGYRGKQPGTDRGKSSGFGLYVSRLLVERRGGWIQLKNRRKGGCEARFTLPLAKPYSVPAIEDPHGASFAKGSGNCAGRDANRQR